SLRAEELYVARSGAAAGAEDVEDASEEDEVVAAGGSLRGPRFDASASRNVTALGMSGTCKWPKPHTTQQLGAVPSATCPSLGVSPERWRGHDSCGERWKHALQWDLPWGIQTEVIRKIQYSKTGIGVGAKLGVGAVRGGNRNFDQGEGGQEWIHEI
ncbi:Protein of unknown function, partial [Gryllus bimaculatus]